jgi:glycosyltransferase involved in cell wall biosynthesis
MSMSNSNLEKVVRPVVPTIMFVATTPFAVNAFLANHIAALSGHCKIILCTNIEAYELLPGLFDVTEVFHIPFFRKISLGTDLKCLWRLAVLVRQIRPVVIHSITPKAGLLAMSSGFVNGVPNRWHTFTGQVWANRKGFSRGLLKGMDWLIAKLASIVLTDSKTQCRLLQAEGIVRKGKVDMLGSGSIAGVDLNRFHPDIVVKTKTRERFGSDENACVFLFVGRIARDKGVFDLLQAFQSLATTVSDIELWLVGPDEEGLLKVLQELAASCNAPIRFLGASTTPEYFMAAADVLLLPSYREGFPSTILESAACEVPTIAYRIYGVLDAIIDGETGVLVEIGQPDNLACAMKSLVLDIELRLRLGQKARERAVRDFSSEKVTKAWLDFYLGHISTTHS